MLNYLQPVKTPYFHSMYKQPTELEMLIQDKRLALEEIEKLKQLIAESENDIRVAEAGIRREMRLLKK